MQKVIITGADGFVGSYTVNKFLNEGKEVLAIDLAESPARLKEHKNLKYLSCSVFEIEKLEKELPVDEYDAFIHFAWVGSAGPARTDYNLQLKNALTVAECIKLAKRIGCQRFMCAGSIMEYEAETAIHGQGTHPGMAYIYGIGKQVAHSIAKAVAANEGIDLLWPMITNAYGVGELSPRFVNSTIRKIIKKEPLEFTAGTQNYDFVYVEDVADAFYLIADKGVPFYEYMIGSGNAKPLKEFVKDLRDGCDPSAELHFGDIPFTGINMPLETFDISELKKLGFEPKTDFKTGTKKTMEWLKGIEQ